MHALESLTAFPGKRKFLCVSHCLVTFLFFLNSLLFVELKVNCPLIWRRKASAKAEVLWWPVTARVAEVLAEGTSDPDQLENVATFAV